MNYLSFFGHMLINHSYLIEKIYILVVDDRDLPGVLVVMQKGGSWRSGSRAEHYLGGRFHVSITWPEEEGRDGRGRKERQERKARRKEEYRFLSLLFRAFTYCFVSFIFFFS